MGLLVDAEVDVHLIVEAIPLLGLEADLAHVGLLASVGADDLLDDDLGVLAQADDDRDGAVPDLVDEVGVDRRHRLPVLGLAAEVAVPVEAAADAVPLVAGAVEDDDLLLLGDAEVDDLDPALRVIGRQERDVGEGADLEQTGFALVVRGLGVVESRVVLGVDNGDVLPARGVGAQLGGFLVRGYVDEAGG